MKYYSNEILFDTVKYILICNDVLHTIQMCESKSSYYEQFPGARKRTTALQKCFSYSKHECFSTLH